MSNRNNHSKARSYVLSHQQRNEMLRRYKEGESATVLAEEYGLHPQYVRVAGRRHGIYRPRTARVRLARPKKALVRFAGQSLRTAAKQENAYFKFRAGADTLQLASYYKCSEATILKWINVERGRQRGLESPYEKSA